MNDKTLVEAMKFINSMVKSGDDIGPLRSTNTMKIFFLFTLLNTIPLLSQCEYPFIFIKLNEDKFNEIDGVEYVCFELNGEDSVSFDHHPKFDEESKRGGGTLDIDYRKDLVLYLEEYLEFVKPDTAKEFFQVYIYHSNTKSVIYKNLTRSHFIGLINFLEMKKDENPELIGLILGTLNLYILRN